MRALLPQLYYFVTVARLRSFTRAAEALNISQSAISYQIKKLEDRLGTQLLIRDARHCTRLTQNGEHLAHCCQDVFAMLDATVENISGKTLEGSLCISADTCLGTLLLAPAIKSLNQRYPRLQISLNITETFLDLGSNNIDVAIRAACDDPRLEYQKLFQTRMVLVAAAHYLQQRPPVKSLQDLSRHCLLKMDEEDYDWQTLQTAKPELALPENNAIHINSALTLAQAVRHGVGIGYIPAYTVAKELQEGTVQALLPESFQDLYVTYYAAYPARASRSEKVTVFIQQFLDYLQQSDCAGAFQFE